MKILEIQQTVQVILIFILSIVLGWQLGQKYNKNKK